MAKIPFDIKFRPQIESGEYKIQKPEMIRWTGKNLKEVIDFIGKNPRFGEWFKSWEEYEKYVHSHNDILKLFCDDGSHYEVQVGDWIVKTPDGYNLPSVAKYIQQKQSLDWSEEDKTTLECSDPFKRFVDMVHSVDKDEFTEFEYSIINFAQACCDKNIAMTPKGIHCHAKTILNIVNKEYSPKICGWTDEEETVLHNACEFIRHRLNDNECRNGNIGGMDYKVLYEKLKSLCNRPKLSDSNILP